MSFTTPSSDELLQNRFPLMESKGFLDATEEDEITKLTGKTMLSSESSCAHYGDLDPKDNKTKPNKRRSRASKKTPMILLNANTTNFRALVQQFTGCQSAPSSSFKGPINLNFGGGGSEENDMDVADHQSSIFGYNNFVQNIQADDQVRDQQQQQLEDHERLLSSGSFDGDASLSTYGKPEAYATALENIGAENGNLFHDFPGDFSSNVLPDDDDFTF